MLSVSIDEIKLTSPSERLLLSGIKFIAAPNKIYTILGNNGTGKTTLLKALVRLTDERFYTVRGSIIYNDKDIYALSQEELRQLRRKKIKYLMQDAVNSFDHLKKFRYYFENVLDDKSLNITETDELLDYFLLPASSKLFKLYPYEVSSGMAQRINFVLALLANPDILLLDEPTSGIDSPIANLFLLKLKDFIAQKNKAVILVSHDLEFARKAGNTAAIIRAGKFKEVSINDLKEEINSSEVKV